MSVLDQFRLDGKIALVTGASKNIGLETTRAFAEAGATVVAVARSSDLLERAVDEVRAATGATVMARTADVGDPASIQQLVETVHSDFDQIDVLVNNAYASGDTYGISAFELPDEAWEQTIAANVLGPYRLCAGFGRRMLAGRGGSIINVLSGSGFLPTRGVTPYGSTKAALLDDDAVSGGRGRPDHPGQRAVPRTDDERDRRSHDGSEHAEAPGSGPDGSARTT